MSIESQEAPYYRSQLEDPEILRLYYQADSEEEDFRPPTPVEEEAQSQEIGASTQDFTNFVETYQDPVLDLEFAAKVVAITHQGVYNGPDHIISREAYEGLRQKTCPICRREIAGAVDLSKSLAKKLEKWSGNLFAKSDDNSLHKAIELGDEALFLALLSAKKGPELLFSKNKGGFSPFDLLKDKPNLLSAVRQSAQLLCLDDESSFALQEEKLFFCTQSKLSVLKIDEQIRFKMLSQDLSFSLKAMDLSEKSPCLYFLSEDLKLFKAENMIRDFDFALRFEMADGKKIELLTTLPLLIGRDKDCTISLGDLHVSRKHWVLSVDDGGDYKIRHEKKSLNKSSLKRGFSNIEISENPEKIQANDKLCIGNDRHILSFKSIALQEKQPFEKSKRRRLETLPS